MIIAYYPYKLKENKYVQISQDILKNCGCKIIDFDGLYKKGKKTIRKCEVVFLNWYDSIYGQTDILSIQKQIFKNKIKLWILKNSGVKVVFTFHNRLPHNIDDEKNVKILRSYAKWICKHSDYIMVLSRNSKEYLKEYLSNHEIQQKVRYIPHPNYIGVYSPAIQKNTYLESKDFRILFAGRVSRYKNVDLILETAEKFQNKRIRFHIAGECSDAVYKAEIINRAKYLSNVELDLRFIEDGELEQLLRQHHIMLLPYDTKSSMNSGTVILAFSNGRTVITPEICTVQDFDLGDIYSYCYESENEHRERLLVRVEDAYNDWMNNRADFESKGTRLLQAVKENNSPEKLAGCYRSLLEEIKNEQ